LFFQAERSQKINLSTHKEERLEFIMKEALEQCS
jgi:16S rRNA U1498 N3-methylase RsmE